ncbi:MAG: ATP-binding protein [Candidatus Omnitrophica bacterium]|nr:ATP-binding protein [Candidatus Omnitrophota bacterium]
MDKRLQSRLQSYLDELCLTTARKRYADIAVKAQKNSWEHELYLLEVMQEESETRRTKRIDRLLRKSGLPLEKNFDTFDLKRLSQKLRQQIKVLADGAFLEHHENILIFGNPGSGKTHLICAIGQELIRQDKRVYFTTCALLLQELLAAKRDLKLPKLFKKLNRYQAIIIDDIGYVQQGKEEMEVLFTLLAERYERGTVMITSNLPFSKWEKIFKDPMMTAAAIDRIIHHSIILELNIPSYRINHAKDRKNRERG